MYTVAMANARAHRLLKLFAAIKVCRMIQHTNGYGALQFYDLIAISFELSADSNKQ